MESKREKILIVDDNPDIREVLGVLLKTEGFHVEDVENGEDALLKIKNDNKWDLLIFDIMMPGINGIELCAKVRQFSNAPVLFLTADSSESSKMDAYEQGGDDYLEKPFDHEELLMKVRVLIRRYNKYQGKVYRKSHIEILSHGIELDTKKRYIIKHGTRLSLTDKEYDILRCLLDHRGETVSAKELFENVWGEEYKSSSGNKIMVHVLNLRRKLDEPGSDENIVQTVWGKGYKIG